MADRSVSVFLKANISDYQKGMLAAGATTKAFTKELNTSTDRATTFTQSLLAIGPALVPLSAAAVPAISGLTNQLAFAAAGAGVTALALSGVGEALKATNDYAIEPTEANLQKMRQTLSELGPAGREFAGFLQQVRPEMQLLQNAAQGGLLPGLEDGIREFMLILPKFERIIFNVASAVGDLFAEGSRELTSDSWREFFDFIEREARPTLLDMGRTLGNFAEGFANLWMAFDPLSDQFSSSFLQMSRDFAAWTDGLDDTAGFQEFLDYVSRVGPQVWDTLGSLGNALLQVAEAAAPVGEASLPIIRALAEVVGTVADSDLGPAIIGIVALTSAYSRLIAVTQAANASAIGGLFGKSAYGGALAAAKDLPSATRATLAFDAAAARAGMSAKEFEKANGRLGTSAKATAKLVGGGAGLAFVMSDLDSKFGLTNTAMLAMAGSLVGPWGTAIGAGVGLVMDFAAAGDNATEKIKNLTAQIKAAGTADLEAQRIAAERAYAEAEVGGGNPDDFAEADKAWAAYKANAAAAQEAKFAEAGLADAMAETGDAARQQVEDMLDAAAAKDANALAALTARDAERGLEEAFDAASESAKENGRNFDINTEKGRANEEALDAIASAWSRTTDEYQRNGENQERVREQFVETATAMGRSREEAEKLFEQLVTFPPEIRTEFVAAGAKNAIDVAVEVAENLDLVPDQVRSELEALNYTDEQIDEVLRRLENLRKQKTEPKITADGSRAKTVIGQVRDALASLKSKSLTIRTYYETYGKPSGGARESGTRRVMGGTVPLGFAGGGIVPGTPPLQPWIDNVMALGESTGRLMSVRSGEWIINESQSKKNDKWLRAINAGMDMDNLFGGPSTLVSREFAGGPSMSSSQAGADGASPAGMTDQDWRRIENLIDGARFQLDTDNRSLMTKIRRG